MFVYITSAVAEVKPVNITLYQPDEVVTALEVDASELSEYIKKLTKSIEQEFSEATIPESLDLVIIVKPGKLSKAWLVSSLKDSPKRQKFLAKLSTIPSIKTINGPFAFAVTYSIAGGKTPSLETKKYKLPMPKECQDAIDKSEAEYTRIPEGIVDTVWKTPK